MKVIGFMWDSKDKVLFNLEILWLLYIQWLFLNNFMASK